MTPTHAPSAAGANRRVVALDAARALGVLAMVFGHTLDALLSPAARAQPVMVEYWKARGFTAPLFLLVAGWTATLAVRSSPARGLGAVRERLPRVVLLLAIGYALRFPGWDVPGLLAGAPASWQHLLEFDVLHTIAVGLLAVVALISVPWRSARSPAILLVALAATAVSLGGRPPGPAPDGLAALALHEALGGTSQFPLFPWVAYFLVGGAVGLLAPADPRRRAAALAAVGLPLVAATFWTGVGSMPPADPILIVYRIGVVLLVVGALGACPAAVARAVAPLGRASLGIYALHLVVVYGWSSYQGLATRVGPVLGVGEAALAALGVLGAAALADRTARAGWRRATAAARRAWERAPWSVASAE